MDTAKVQKSRFLIIMLSLVLMISGCETMAATGTGKLHFKGVCHMVKAGVGGEPISIEDLNDLPPAVPGGPSGSGNFLADIDETSVWIEQNMW
jgi:hypothetical protein